MPSTRQMFTINGEKRSMLLDARPDRVDLRDRPYLPQLRNLPHAFPGQAFIDEHLGEYCKLGLVLDQGNEGACTGFGLAAVVNFLLWGELRKSSVKKSKSAPKLETVSPRMFYTLARRYDEWPGEDYDGSSCRGAMKGWHRHGVCTDTVWPYRNPKSGEIEFVEPHPNWAADAAGRPLGAYYRVDKDSAVDMQSAIAEVGAIYASASAHSGWSNLVERPNGKEPLIGPKRKGEHPSGHAFALVGYTHEGFIVQNSWGTDWGLSGFAVLPYEDWFQHGMDAWVAVLGAPMLGGELSAGQAPSKGKSKSVSVSSVAVRTVTHTNLQSRAGGQSLYSWSPKLAEALPQRDPPVLTEDQSYLYAIVLGNNGEPINRFIDRGSAADAVKEVAFTLPKEWLSKNRTSSGKPSVLIYAHGGLNHEEASLERIGVLSPIFLRAGIYPIFITWKTGVVESIVGKLQDAVGDLFGAPVEGFLDGVTDALTDARDRTVEIAARNLGVKAIWSEMKQNAEASAADDSGLSLLAQHLQALNTDLGGIGLHLVGHSAGGILHGHLLDVLARDTTLRAETCHLFAPACTVDFAAAHYLPALQGSPKSRRLGKLTIDVLSDKIERDDVVGSKWVYAKSLLYLVSRALEQEHKTPLLGMEAAWTKLSPNEDVWNAKLLSALKSQIDDFKDVGVEPAPYTIPEAPTAPGKTISRAHGSFDNDIDAIAKAISIADGSLTKDEKKSLDLTGF